MPSTRNKTLKIQLKHPPPDFVLNLSKKHRQYLCSLEFVEFRFTLTCDFGKIPTSFGWFNRYPRNHPAKQIPKKWLSIIQVLQIVSLRTYVANRSQEVNVNVDKYNPPSKLLCCVSCTRNEVKVAKLSFQICWQVNIDTKNACRKCTRLKSSVLKKSCDDLRTFKE